MFAPVLICTLNRFTHFKQCVESLANCINARNTDLFVGLDFPSCNEHWQGYNEIKKYLPTINGFKNVNIVYREKNYGVNDNWSNMIEYVFDRYDRLIISEDDNIFSASFLDFVNMGLVVYKNRSDIFSISGYNYPFNMPAWYKHNTYLAPAFSGWGVGVWRDKYNKVIFSLENFDHMFNKKSNVNILKNNYEIWFSNLLYIKEKRILKGDGIILLHMIDNKMFTLFPTNTNVINLGNDGSGQNCKVNHIYTNQKFKNNYNFHMPVDFNPDRNMLTFFYNQLKQPLFYKIKSIIPQNLKFVIKKILNKSFH